jgi:hypothetical protein
LGLLVKCKLSEILVTCPTSWVDFSMNATWSWGHPHIPCKLWQLSSLYYVPVIFCLISKIFIILKSSFSGKTWYECGAEFQCFFLYRLFLCWTISCN